MRFTLNYKKLKKNAAKVTFREINSKNKKETLWLDEIKTFAQKR